MANYIASGSTGRTIQTLSEKQIATDYEVTESNPNSGMDILRDVDGNFWIKIPITEDSAQLHPCVATASPTME